MLGTGLLVYMLSKEIYVVNHETLAAASIGAVIIYGVKKFGPSVAAFADKLNEVGWCSDMDLIFIFLFWLITRFLKKTAQIGERLLFRVIDG